MKWMAIEQLGIEEGQTRPYTEETDVWSFGVTVWEIFSKGINDIIIFLLMQYSAKISAASLYSH